MQDNKKYRDKNKESVREKERQWEVKNSEKIARRKAEYYIKNKDRMNKQSKEWKEKNRKRKGKDNSNHAWRMEFKDKTDWICCICDKKAEYNDKGNKYCVKHWCKLKGIPYDQRHS